MLIATLTHLCIRFYVHFQKSKFHSLSWSPYLHEKTYGSNNHKWCCAKLCSNQARVSKTDYLILAKHVIKCIKVTYIYHFPIFLSRNWSSFNKWMSLFLTLNYAKLRKYRKRGMLIFLFVHNKNGKSKILERLRRKGKQLSDGTLNALKMI